MPCLPVNGRTAPSTPTEASRHAWRALRTESLPLKRFHIVRSPRRFSSQDSTSSLAKCGTTVIASASRVCSASSFSTRAMAVAAPSSGQIGVVPAPRRIGERVEHGADHLVAHRQRGEQLLARRTDPFGGHHQARDHVARMAAVATPDEEIVVIVATQQHAVGERGNVRGRPQRRAPYHGAVRHGDSCSWRRAAMNAGCASAPSATAMEFAQGALCRVLGGAGQSTGYAADRESGQKLRDLVAVRIGFGGLGHRLSLLVRFHRLHMCRAK